MIRRSTNEVQGRRKRISDLRKKDGTTFFVTPSSFLQQGIKAALTAWGP